MAYDFVPNFIIWNMVYKVMLLTIVKFDVLTLLFTITRGHLYYFSIVHTFLVIKQVIKKEQWPFLKKEKKERAMTVHFSNGQRKVFTFTKIIEGTSFDKSKPLHYK